MIDMTPEVFYILAALFGGGGLVWTITKPKVKELAKEALKEDLTELKDFITLSISDLKEKTVTPQQLEIKHREILEDAEKKFVLIKQYQEMKENEDCHYRDLKDSIKEQNETFTKSIDKLFDLLRGKSQ